MTFRDKEIHCSDCGTRFGFSAEEQSFYAQKGLDHEPRRCKPCRSARKSKTRDGRHEPSRPPAARGNPPSPQDGGPFVRHSRHNSHGSPRRTPWVLEEREQRPAGIWQPRHGKSPTGDAPLFKADFGPSPHDRSLPGNGPGRRGQRNGNSRPDRQGRGPRAIVLHDAVCSDCKAATQVPFKPNRSSPVYCRTCLPKHKTQKPGPRQPARGGQAHRSR